MYFRDGETLNLSVDKCTGCGMCVEVCPHGVFRVQERKAEAFRKEFCMECGACAMNCPAGAISVKAGVGCAAAVITGFLNKTEPTCDCSGSSKKTACCG